MRTMSKQKQTLKPGDTFTVAGCMIGRRGQLILNGRSVDTNRKANGIGLFKFLATKMLGGQ